MNDQRFNEEESAAKILVSCVTISLVFAIIGIGFIAFQIVSIIAG